MLSDFAIRYIQYNSNRLNSGKPLERQHWGLAIAEIENMFMYLTALPIPVVVIFHDRETNEGDVVVQEISIFGKNLPRKIISMFGEVVRQRVRMVQGKMEPYLQTVQDTYTTIRSRSGVVDGFKTSEGFRKFMELVS